MLNKYIQTNIFYISITASLVRMKHVNSGAELEIDPTIVINEKGEVIAVGDSLQISKAQDNPNYKIANGFKHPRTCMSDFEVAEATLSYLYKKLKPFLIINPDMIIQPLEKLEGNITRVEARWLRELGESIGAKKVYIWVGETLTDHEMLSLDFPEDKGHLF